MSYNTVQRDVLYLHDPTMATVSLQVQALAFNTKKMKPGRSAEELGRGGKSQIQRHDRTR